MARLGLVAGWTAAMVLVGLIAHRWVWRSFYRDLSPESIVRRERAEQLAGATTGLCLLVWFIGMLVIIVAFNLGS